MSPEQAAILVDSVQQLQQFANAFGYTVLGVLCGLVFAVAWRA